MSGNNVHHVVCWTLIYHAARLQQRVRTSTGGPVGVGSAFSNTGWHAWPACYSAVRSPREQCSQALSICPLKLSPRRVDRTEGGSLSVLEGQNWYGGPKRNQPWALFLSRYTTSWMDPQEFNALAMCPEMRGSVITSDHYIKNNIYIYI